MKDKHLQRRAAMTALSLAALLSSSVLLADSGKYERAEQGEMMHQMMEMQQAGRAMHDAEPDRRPQAMAEHRREMMKMMHMMRDEHGPGDGPMSGQRGAGMGMGMGTTDAPPDMTQMRRMRQRMDRLEIMMGEMLDHMDMYERQSTHR